MIETVSNNMKELNGIELDLKEFEELCSRSFTHDFAETISRFREFNYGKGLKLVSQFDPSGEMEGTDEEWISDTETCSVDGVPCLVCLLQVRGLLPKDKDIYLYV